MDPKNLRKLALAATVGLMAGTAAASLAQAPMATGRSTSGRAPQPLLTKGRACQILANKCESGADANACGHWLAHCQ